jgi:hypothetical protein
LGAVPDEKLCHPGSSGPIVVTEETKERAREKKRKREYARVYEGLEEDRSKSGWKDSDTDQEPCKFQRACVLRFSAD